MFKLQKGGYANFFLKKITPVTNCCGRGDSFNLGITTQPRFIVAFAYEEFFVGFAMRRRIMQQITK